MKKINNALLTFNEKSSNYSLKIGGKFKAFNLELYSSPWRITWNNESVNYYQNDEGVIVLMLTKHASDTGKALVFTADSDFTYNDLIDLIESKNTTDLGCMMDLIEMIKDQ